MAANVSPLFALVNKHSVLILAATGGGVTVVRCGERLRAARTFKDWTQAQLAEASGVSQSLISQLERSGTATGSEYTVRLARALDVSPDWLADEQGPMRPTTYAVTDPKLIAICVAMQDSAEYVKDAAVKAVLTTRELAEQARADVDGPCPVCIADHVIPLCAGGRDTVGNLQWQPIISARVKDNQERQLCRSIKNSMLIDKGKQ